MFRYDGAGPALPRVGPVEQPPVVDPLQRDDEAGRVGASLRYDDVSHVLIEEDQHRRDIAVEALETGMLGTRRRRALPVRDEFSQVSGDLLVPGGEFLGG